MSTNSYNWYNARKRELNKLVIKQLEIVEKLEMDKNIKAGEKPSHQLKILSKRLRDENLNVLVMGLFSSGKSTFINALLGKRILPTSRLPTTAVISIIKYSQNPEIILYPKKGKWEDGDEPFSIQVSELKKYITIDNESEEKISTPFQKMELFWDLDLCKNKIEIVDSPGLDDPDSHDTVTMEYLPLADAIIYCMSSNHPYTRKDRETIEELRNLEYSSIIFILTNFDGVEDSALLDGDDQDKVFIRSMNSKLSKLTDLGEEGIFFVNSLNGVLGKERNDSKLLDSSYFIPMEKKLEQFLVSQKGKAKLYKGVLVLKKINKEASKTIEDRLTLSKLSLDELQNRYENAKKPFERAREKGRLIVNQIKLGNKDIVNAAEDKGRIFIIDCREKVEDWVRNFTPTSKISKNPFKIKQSVKNVANDYLGEIKVRMQQESAKWSKESLSPMIITSIRNMFAGLEDSIKSYQKEITEIRLELSLDKTGDDIAEAEDPSTASRLTGLIYTVLTMDYVGGAMAATFGWKGLLKSLVTQITAGIILGIAAQFTPIGLPALIIAVIIAGFAGAGWNFISIKNNIRKRIIAETINALSDRVNQDEMVKQIKKNVEKELERVVDNAEKALEDDLFALKAEMEKAIEDRKKGSQKIEVNNKILLEEHKKNKELEESLLDFSMDMSLT